MKICDWTVIQQKNGFGEIEFEYSVPENWLFEPVTHAEIKCSKEFTGICVEVIEEDTGRYVNCDITVKKITKRDYSVSVKKLPAGGLYTFLRALCFCGENGNTYQYGGHDMARHVGVGDVYIIAGQSNAAGWARGSIYEAPQIGVHACRAGGRWDLATHPFSGTGHSPFLTFAKTMHRHLGYPIGLVTRAIGGVPVSSWMKGGTLMEQLKEEIKDGLNAKAVLWYQGCSDTGREDIEKYEDDVLSFVSEVRTALSNEKLPIFTFQLNKLHDEDEKADMWNEGYSKIREIQRSMAKKVNDLYVIPTIDCGIMSDAIHNAKASNIMLGDRLAYLMLDVIYNKLKSPKAPDIVSAQITKGNELTLTFDNVESYLEAYAASASTLPIKLTDSDGEVKAEKYTVDKNKIIITYEREIKENAKVSGMYGKNPSRWIIDYITQLPVLCFNDFKAER